MRWLSDTVEEIKEEQETIKRRLIEASDDERPDLKVQYNRISAKWTNRFLQLARQEMAKDMDSYMSDLAKGKISPYRGTDDILTLERVSLDGNFELNPALCRTG